MDKIQILNIIAWIFIIIGIILLIWRIFGNSPDESYILSSLTIGLLIKVMAISSIISSLRSDHLNLEKSFRALAQDFKEHIKHK